MAEKKLCIDCKFCIDGRKNFLSKLFLGFDETAKCTHPVATHISHKAYVSGKDYNYYFPCEHHRKYGGDCGPQGKLWVAKNRDDNKG